VLSANRFDFEKNKPEFTTDFNWKRLYRRELNYLLRKDNVEVPFKPRQQRNTFSNLPYSPIRIDPRWGRNTDVSRIELLVQESNRGSNKKIQRGRLSYTPRFSLHYIDAVVSTVWV